MNVLDIPFFPNRHQYNTTWLTHLSMGGKLCLLVIFLIICLAITAPIVCPHSHRIPSGTALVSPNTTHWMGTDELGVDIWAQIVHGARISLLVGLGTALIAGLGGAIAGGIAGYKGGLTDTILMRIIDVLLVLPDLPVLIVLAAFFGPSVITIITVLSAFSWVMTARIIRSRMLSLKERCYIKAAESYGAGIIYLMRRHFLPELFPLIAVGMIRLAGRAIIAEAGLSFLGLGDPTSRSWGLIIHNSLHFPGIYYTNFWKWWLLFPWLALMLVVTSLAVLGRDLEKIADPRMQEC